MKALEQFLNPAGSGTVSWLRGLVLALGLFVLTIAAFAQSATNISFQGALTGANGQPLANGNYNLTFKFYTNATTLFALGTSSVVNVLVTGGIASTPVPVDAAWFNGETRYLGITINNGPELSPRVLLTAVPYSMGFTGNKLSVDGFESSIQLRNTADPYAAVDTFWKFDSAGWGRQGSFSLERSVNGSIGGPTIYSDKDSKTVAITPDPGEGPGKLNDPGFTAAKFQVLGHRHADIRLMDYDAIGGGWWSIDPNAFDEGYFNILRWNDSTSPFSVLAIDRAGNVGIGTRSAQTKLDVNGTTRTKVLQITGGADLAEHLSVSAAKPSDEFKVEPGMVVSIDPSGNRKFKLSDEPYDRKRVGIISGGHGVQPGLVLRDEGNPSADGDQPIALTGQVWVHADASFGPITPGDLLTTSATLGHAMKVTDDSKARFAVLGQALTELKEGRGWVQVLVGKQ